MTKEQFRELLDEYGDACFDYGRYNAERADLLANDMATKSENAAARIVAAFEEGVKLRLAQSPEAP
jgi:hypothetical protein